MQQGMEKEEEEDKSPLLLFHRRRRRRRRVVKKSFFPSSVWQGNAFSCLIPLLLTVSGVMPEGGKREEEEKEIAFLEEEKNEG